MKNLIKRIKEWDKKNTTMDSLTYMNLFLLAAAIFAANLNQAAANLAML